MTDRLRRWRRAMDSVSLLVATANALLTLAAIYFDTSVVAGVIANNALPLRVLVLIGLECCLGYGFGLAFAYISSISADIQYKRRATRLLHPPTLMLLVLAAFVSAGVTYINIDLLVASFAPYRSLTLAIAGSLAALYGLVQMRSHLWNQDVFREDEVRTALGLQLCAFAALYPVFAAFAGFAS